MQQNLKYLLCLFYTLRPCQNLVHILPTMQFNHQQFASDIQVCYASNGKYSLKPLAYVI